MFDVAPLFPVEDIGYVVADGASRMGVERGEYVPVLRLEAPQNGLGEGVGVVGEASIGGAYRVDGAASRVVQDAAHILQGLVRRVVSAVSFALLGGGCYAVGMPLLERVAAGGDERSEVGVASLSLRYAGVL